MERDPVGVGMSVKGSDAPYDFEDMFKLQNEPDAPMPVDVSRVLSTPKVYLSGVGSDFNLGERLARNDEDPPTFSLELPEGAAVGLPGRTMNRMERAEADIPAGDTTPGFRPQWSGISYQPRPAAPFRHGKISTIKGGTVEQFYGIYGPDDRQVYYPQDYPWRCTGRIFTYTSWPASNWSWSGSGVLIGPRHVLTAGHVIPWGASTWAMLFVPAYWDGASIFGAGATSYVSDNRGWNTGKVAANDIGLLRLYEPLGNQLGWLGTKVYDSGWENQASWVLTGYPGAIAGAERPVYQNGVAVLDDDSDSGALELEHHGDSSPGESGGPMFGTWSDGVYAIGATSGGETISGGIFGIGDEDNNIAAGGGAMVDLVKWGLTTWT